MYLRMKVAINLVFNHLGMINENKKDGVDGHYPVAKLNQTSQTKM